jgi:membrane associated rhomboid family serine protease
MSDPNPEFNPYPWKRPIAWVTWTLLGSTIAVFLFQLYEFHTRGYDVVGDTLAFSQQSFADHRYWTLITYAWAHAVAMFGDSSLFWLHIAANMIFLFCLGPALEECLGPWRYLGLYLGGAMAAALFWLVFSSSPDAEQGIIGASGAIFALIAGAATAAPRERVVVYLFYILPIKMTLRTMALVICGAELAQIVFGWLPEIAHSAHLGGALFGFLYVMVIRFVFRKKTVYG